MIYLFERKLIKDLIEIKIYKECLRVIGKYKIYIKK